MWHQTPRACVCYYKLFLYPLSYLHIRKLMTVLTKETEIPACFICFGGGALTTDEGKMIYYLLNFKHSLSSV